MLHFKFPRDRLSESGEEDFISIFTIYGHDSHLGHVTWIKYMNVVPCAKAAYVI